MSTSTTNNAVAQRWMTAEQMRATGFWPAGPEIDYGMRWGESGEVRVSFAPSGDGEGGYLYAHDRATQHFLLLATRTTPDQVQSAWLELNSLTTSPDGYLAFASLEGAPPLSPAVEAGQLLLRCVEQEMAAYDEFVATGPDHALRFDAAYAVVVQRSARIAAEDAQIDAVRSAAADTGPVVIRYRVLGESGWTGRVAGESLQSAADDARRVHAIGERHGLVTQATSVSQHHAVISAARVPVVAFMLHLPEVPSSAPRLEL